MVDKLSAILQYQLPEFVRNDHELFVAFVQAYYEWMELEGNTLNFIQSFQQNSDVDTANDDFLDMFITEFGDTFPKNIQVDKSTLLKSIREFYISKGSESSFRFIFNVLYGAEIDIIYPREFLQTASGGNFFAEDYAYITGDNFFKLKITDNLNASIEGVTSGANAVIDGITSIYIGSQRILRCDLSSYEGIFEVDEEILLTVEGFTVKENVYGLINSINVDDGGTNYSLNDEVVITSVDDGSRAKARIKSLSKGPLDSYTIVDGGLGYEVNDIVHAVPVVGSNGYSYSGVVETVGGSGEITGIRILNNGYDYSLPTTASIVSSTGSGAIISLNGDAIGKINEIEVYDSGLRYTSQPTITVTSSNGSGVSLSANIECIFNEPKKYQDEDDWLSDYSKLQDSYYYQQYSYVVRSDVSPHKWIEQVKRIAHPSGTQLFGMYTTSNIVDTLISLPPRLQASLTKIIYLFSEINSSILQTEFRELILHLGIANTCVMGLTLDELDEIKFDPNFNWVIGYFDNLSLSNIETTGCVDKFNRMEDSDLTII